jgi:serine/threonine-protein kinase
MKALQVLGKYELLQKIGSGGMAEVYRARQKGVEGFEKLVVVKKILPGYARNLSFIKMLVEEAKLTSVLQHPNVVQIFELDNVENQYYMAMEFVDGKDLLKILGRCAETKVPFPAELACVVAAEVCRGLHYAHNAKDIYGKPLNIIHRDVSPSNIIVSWEGLVKVMDFGVAKARTEDTKGSKHVLRGKLGYMSPEQVKGEEIDQRSDIFSLGIVLFESLTLKRLFLGKTDLETLINIRDADVEKKFEKYPFIDEGLRGVLRRALAADKDQRFSSALEFANALTDYLFKAGKRPDTQPLASFLNGLFASAEEEKDLPTPPTMAQPGAGRNDLSDSKTMAQRPRTAPGVRPRPEPVEPPEPQAVRGADSEEPPPIPEEAVAERPTPVPIVVEASPGEAQSSPEVRPEETTGSAAIQEEESSPKIGMEPLPPSSPLDGHEFKLRNTSGYVFGPVDYENLVNLVQTGAVSEDEFVSIDGKDWRRVREITAMRSISPNEALRTKGISPIYSGSVTRTGLVRVFYQVASRLLSGKLRFVKGSSQKEFYFTKGKPKHVASTLKQELLGPFLLRRGVVKEEQMSAALEKSTEFGGRLGDALVSLGFVKPHELYWLLDQQFQEKFLQIFSWSQGTYEFYEGVPCPIDMAPSDANVYRYIVEGVRKYATSQDLEPFFRQFMHAPVKERKNQFVQMDKLPFNAREQRLWGQVQRHLTVGRVVKDVCKTDEDRTSLFQLLLVLVQLELISFHSK